MATTPIRTVSPLPGPGRLYLREEELLAGVATLFEAAAVLKTASGPARTGSHLTWAELRVLMALSVAEDTVMGLAYRLSVTKQALTRNLDDLETRGLIRRTADRRDRRRRITGLTPHGLELLTGATAAMRQRLAQAYRSAGTEAVAGCDRVISALVGPGAGPAGPGAGR